MINLIEGKIDLGAKKIIVFSEYEDLNNLAEEGLIEKRKDPSKGEPYFYVESVEDDMKFGVIISMQKKKIEWLLLRWLDGPCTSKGWDGVSEEALKDEYRMLLKFVERRVGSLPNNKKNRQHTWNLKWGKIEVSYDQRDFVVAIFMRPR
jgi:hypothetical protein